MKPAPGTVIGGRFRLERRLDEGGMGEVWMAEHLTLGSPCAVKLLKAANNHPDALGRFEREAQAAAKLRSPYVVQILDYGVEDDTPYIAMEYLEGESLLSKLLRDKKLTAEETCRWVDDVARALEKAHNAGVIHRDLKPGNIFLETDEDGTRAKVLDFGVAKQSDTSKKRLTHTGVLLGTPYYMSPEQAMRPAEVDHRADLWSLAVIVYRCLSGQRPFPGRSVGDLLTAIMGEPPVPSANAPHIPRGFDAWFRKGVRRDPEERFDSARTMAEQLRTSLGVGAPSRPSLPSIGPAGDWLDEDATRPVFRSKGKAFSEDMETKPILLPKVPSGARKSAKRWSTTQKLEDETTLQMDDEERTIDLGGVAAKAAKETRALKKRGAGTRKTRIVREASEPETPPPSQAVSSGPHWRSLAMGMVAAGGIMLGYQAVQSRTPASSPAPSPSATASAASSVSPQASVVAAMDAPTPSATTSAPRPPMPARPLRLPPAVPAGSTRTVPSASPTAEPSASAPTPAPETTSKYGDHGF